MLCLVLSYRTNAHLSCISNNNRIDEESLIPIHSSSMEFYLLVSVSSATDKDENFLFSDLIHYIFLVTQPSPALSLSVHQTLL